jgi:hypothetical protein
MFKATGKKEIRNQSRKEEKRREELLANVAKKNIPRSSNFTTS